MAEHVLTTPVQENRHHQVFAEGHNETHQEATAEWEGYSQGILDAIHDPWTRQLATLDLPPPTQRLRQEE